MNVMTFDELVEFLEDEKNFKNVQVYYDDENVYKWDKGEDEDTGEKIYRYQVTGIASVILHIKPILTIHYEEYYEYDPGIEATIRREIGNMYRNFHDLFIDIHDGAVVTNDKGETMSEQDIKLKLQRHMFSYWSKAGDNFNDCIKNEEIYKDEAPWEPKEVW